MRLFIANRNSENLSYNLSTSLQIDGIVSTVCFLLILVLSIFLRKRKYELFYVTHIAFSVLALITLYRHRPYFQTKTLVFVVVCAGLYAIDKNFRIGKYAYYRFFCKTTATLHPLPHGGTRVVLSQSLHNTSGGLHARLWIPKIRALQTHPMTLTSTSPVSFVVSAQTGFTAALHQYARTEPGAALSATFDGPYGCLPPFDRYDTTILIAGGSGAAWTFAVCMDLLVRNPNARIEFVWVARRKGMFVSLSHAYPTLVSRFHQHSFL